MQALCLPFRIYRQVVPYALPCRLASVTSWDHSQLNQVHLQLSGQQLIFSSVGEGDACWECSRWGSERGGGKVCDPPSSSHPSLPPSHHHHHHPPWAGFIQPHGQTRNALPLYPRGSAQFAPNSVTRKASRDVRQTKGIAMVHGTMEWLSRKTRTKMCNSSQANEDHWWNVARDEKNVRLWCVLWGVLSSCARVLHWRCSQPHYSLRTFKIWTCWLQFYCCKIGWAYLRREGPQLATSKTENCPLQVGKLYW